MQPAEATLILGVSTTNYSPLHRYSRAYNIVEHWEQVICKPKHGQDRGEVATS